MHRVLNIDRLASNIQVFCISSGIVLISMAMDAFAVDDDKTNKANSPIDGTLQTKAPTPPAAEVAKVIEIVCPQGIASSNLQRDCNTLVGAAIAEDSSAGSALLQITPDDASIAVDASQNSMAAQTENINTRLTALRRGAYGINLSGLKLNINDQYLSDSSLSDLYSPAGSGASSDSLGFSRLGFFINGSFSYGDRDRTLNEDGFEFDTLGITLGLDYRFTDRLIFGAAVGYSNTDTETDKRGGKLDTEGFVGTLFGTYYHSDASFIEGSISYGNNDYSQQRSARYLLADSTLVDQTWFTDYAGNQFTLILNAGHEIRYDALTFTPSSRLQYIKASVDNYREGNVSNPTAAGSGWGLEIDSQAFRSFTLGLGGQVNYALSQSWGVLLPYGSFEWVHEFKDQSEIVSGRFLGDPSATTFRFSTDNPEQNYLNLGIGISALFSEGSAAFLNYQTILGYDNLDYQSINGGFRFEF